MKKDPHLDYLIQNAFDFLETSIKQFDKEPKYSVINFCAAVELFLKARLVHEHWSLIVQTKNNEHPNREKFLKGDFISTPYSQLIDRIKHSCGEQISKECKKCFDDLGQHRNKMIHFFHNLNGDASCAEQEKKKIAAEQTAGWFHLQRLLTITWQDIFSNYSQEVTEIKGSMKSQDAYLNTVFQKIEPEIKEAKSKGTIFESCSYCSFDAAEVKKELTSNISMTSCRVCEKNSFSLTVGCFKEGCTGEHYLSSDDVKCSECREEPDSKNIKKHLERADYVYFKEGGSSVTHCANCDSDDSVIHHEKGYRVCMECYFFTDNEIAFCDYCGTGYIGLTPEDMDMSYGFGCNSITCEGAASYAASKAD